MSENCNQNCESCSSGCSSSGQKPQSFEDFREPMHPESRVKHVIGIVSGKGGVGKSLTTAMLAVLLNRRGFKTGVLDADITGPSIPRLFGLTGKAGADKNAIYPVVTKTGIETMSVNLLLENETDPVVWRGPVIGSTVKQFWQEVIWTNLDFLFVDMPPGTGDVPLTVFQAIPLDGIIIVTSPQQLVNVIVSKAVKMAKMMQVPVVGVVENMSYLSCPDCGKKIELYGQSHAGEIATRFGIPLLAQIPIQPENAALADEGRIELFTGDWLNLTADTVEAML